MLLTTTAMIGGFVVHLGALVVHVVTVWFAYQLGGLLPAILTFFTPPFAEVYWAFDTWMRYGVFFNLFTQMCLAVVAGYIFIFVAALLGAFAEERIAR